MSCVPFSSKFDAFGNLTAESDATVKFLYSYTGREWDGDAGLYYYRARWYDAKIGRFISEDPIGFSAGDTNVNRYIGNSPINGTDPAGLDSYWGTFFYELPSAYYDTAVSGQQYDSMMGSFTGMIDNMTWGHTDYSNMNPHYGNVDAYLNGREVGDWWGAANQTAMAAYTLVMMRMYLTTAPPILTRVTSWASVGTTPTLESGRWVIVGGGTYINYLRTGLVGGKWIDGQWVANTADYGNRITMLVFTNTIRSPIGNPAANEPWLAYVKWLFGHHLLE